MHGTRSGLITVAAAAFIISFGCQTLHADRVTLKNGNVVEGQIVREEGATLRINTGASELTISTTTVDHIERGVSPAFAAQKAKRSLDAGDALLKKGNNSDAAKIFGSAILELNTAIQKVPAPTPPELLDLKTKLETGRRNSLPKDSNSVQAEELYQSALRAIDHIAYPDAFKLLQESAALAPERTDVQFRLAGVAQQVNNPTAALSAYRELLKLEPETYYQEVSTPYLNLLITTGKRLVATRKADEAIDIFKEVLVLQSARQGEPTTVDDFLVRRTTQEAKSEDKVLMEVYQYADSNDLVDLAFAAVSRVVNLKPEDAEIAKLAGKAKVLSDLDHALKDGDEEGAARIVATAGPELAIDERFSKKLAAAAAGVKDQIESEKLLVETKAAYDVEDFATAESKAKEIITTYPKTAAATEAVKIADACAMEIPILKHLEVVRSAYEKMDFDLVEAEASKAITEDKFNESRYAAEIRKRLGTAPDERAAAQMYDAARADIDRENFAAALVTLEEISSRYGETLSGAKAAEWLTNHRIRLQQEADKSRLIDENSFFAIADPSLWRAASIDTGGTRARQQAVDSNMRPEAWKVFDRMKSVDVEASRERRNMWLFWMIPIIVAGALLAYLKSKYAPAGKGAYRDEDKTTRDSRSGGGQAAPVATQATCRMCGMVIAPDVLICNHCDSPRQLSTLEEDRLHAEERAADYDPWDIRVKGKTANDYEKYFQVARDLSQTSDVQAAIENCRKALSEDPHRKDGYLLLAELYERVGKQEEAAKCYREILLIDPAEIVVRKKIEALLSLSSVPLRLGRISAALSATLWWLVFWTVIGVDPHNVLLRLGLCIVGGGLNFMLWKQTEKTHRHRLIGNQRAAPDTNRPVPVEMLTNRSQTRQATQLARAIETHTGVRVPVLSSLRLYVIGVVSILFLVLIIWVAWLNQTPWIIMGWPAAVVLLIFALEIYPRAFTAHVILRHIYEETSSPWVDPHRPFKPKGKDVKGEFLITAYDELPLRWALNPFPHHATRQGILNSLQQTLNRHWECHHFYEGLHIVRDVDVPMPMTMRPIILMIVLLMAVSGFGATSMTWNRVSAETRYDEATKAGYIALLDGDIEKARNSFLVAAQIHRSATLPQLYLAHSNAALGYGSAAERCFRKAVKLAGNVAVIRNDFGNFLQKNGRLKDAIQQYIAALEVDPTNSDVLNNLGSGYYKIREYEKAARQLEEATKVNPTHSRAFTTLGLAYEGMGDWPKAQKAYQRAVVVAPDLAYTQIAKDRLAAGESKEPESLTLGAAGGN